MPRPNTLRCKGSRFVIHLLGLVLTAAIGHHGIDGELALAALIEADEPVRRLVNRLSDGEQPVVLQDADLVLRPQSCRDILPLLGRQDDAAVVEIDAVGVVKAEGVLHQGGELFAENGVGLAVYTVGVADGVDPGMGLVDLAVY